MTTEPTTDRAAARDLAADAIRAAACPGNDCPLSEADCSEQRIQPAAWERGVLSEVYGRPEWFADAVLAVLPDPTDWAAVLREAADDLATAFGDPMAKHIGALGASHLRRRAREIEAGQAAEEQPETPLEKRLRYSERRNDELRAECKRRGKTVLEQSEKIRALERQIDEVRRQLGAEILRAGQAEAELRRLAAEAQPTTKPETATLAAALDGLHTLIATSSRDWGEYRVDAWLWAVLVGWDCEERHEHDGLCDQGAAMAEMALQHGWDHDTVAKARRYRAAVRALTELAAGVRQDGAQPQEPPRG